MLGEQVFRSQRQDCQWHLLGSVLGDQAKGAVPACRYHRPQTSLTRLLAGHSLHHLQVAEHLHIQPVIPQGFRERIHHPAPAAAAGRRVDRNQHVGAVARQIAEKWVQNRPAQNGAPCGKTHHGFPGIRCKTKQTQKQRRFGQEWDWPSQKLFSRRNPLITVQLKSKPSRRQKLFFIRRTPCFRGHRSHSSGLLKKGSGSEVFGVMDFATKKTHIRQRLPTPFHGWQRRA